MSCKLLHCGVLRNTEPYLWKWNLTIYIRDDNDALRSSSKINSIERDRNTLI